MILLVFYFFEFLFESLIIIIVLLFIVGDPSMILLVSVEIGSHGMILDFGIWPAARPEVTDINNLYVLVQNFILYIFLFYST